MPDAELERELEVARARERQSEETIGLLERRLEEAERSGGRAAQLELELRSAQQDVRDVELRAEHLQAENAELRRVNRELEATAAHFREVNDGLMSSLSWRITTPLRAVKGAGKR